MSDPFRNPEYCLNDKSSVRPGIEKILSDSCDPYIQSHYSNTLQRKYRGIYLARAILRRWSCTVTANCWFRIGVNLEQRKLPDKLVAVVRDNCH